MVPDVNDIMAEHGLTQEEAAEVVRALKSKDLDPWLEVGVGHGSLRLLSCDLRPFVQGDTQTEREVAPGIHFTREGHRFMVSTCPVLCLWRRTQRQ